MYAPSDRRAAGLAFLLGATVVVVMEAVVVAAISGVFDPLFAVSRDLSLQLQQVGFAIGVLLTFIGAAFTVAPSFMDRFLPRRWRQS